MDERNADANSHHSPERQQAQDVLPGGRLHVNGAEGGPVSPPAGGGKGGGGKSPPGGNGKAPPGNGAEGGRSLDTRMAVLETEHKHLATKADLHATEGMLRKDLHASETRLRKEIHASETRLRKEIQGVKEELRKEAQENKEELTQKIDAAKDTLQADLRRMPFLIVGLLAGLATVVGVVVALLQHFLG